METTDTDTTPCEREDAADTEDVRQEEEEDEGEASPPRRAQVVTDSGLPLDWTRVAPKETASVVRYPSDVSEIPTDGDELVIVGTAGQKITNMGTNLSEVCPAGLKQLVLRSHLIKVMEGLNGFTELELLELYDNMIPVLQDLNEGPGGAPGETLRVLDMSYNVIRDMTPVRCCPHLQELYLANNKLKSMAGLKGLTQLKKIDLGANRFRFMDSDELSGLVNLEELWLGKNKIECIEGLEKLTKLRRLDVQSNRLTEVANLTSQVPTLEELYLAHNGITDEGAKGLAQFHFTNLVTLDMSRNQLTTTQHFAHLTSLEDLWLSGNLIVSFDKVTPLSALSLEELYLEYNPLADDFEYRKKLKEMIPSLLKIDATMIAGVPGGSSSGGAAETVEAKLRRLQDLAIAKAKAETEAAKRG